MFVIYCPGLLSMGTLKVLLAIPYLFISSCACLSFHHSTCAALRRLRSVFQHADSGRLRMSTGTGDKLLSFSLYTGTHVCSFVPLHSASLGETLLGCYLPCVPGTLAFSIYVSTGKKKEEAYGQGTLKDSYLLWE